MLGFGLAPLGSKTLYAFAVILGVVAVGYLTHDVLGPPLRDAIDRVRPSRHRGGAAVLRPSVARRIAAGCGVTLAAGAGGWFVAQQGMKAILAIGALLLLGMALWLLFPLVNDLMRTAPEEEPSRTNAVRPRPAGANAKSSSSARVPASGSARVMGTTCTVFAAGILAWVAAQMGIKGLLALVGAVGAITLFGYVRDRSVFFTFAAVCSLAFILHKSFSSQDLQQSGGAISIYITTFDAMIVLLYGIWIFEGTFRSDVRAATQRRILALPVLGALLLVPSLVAAPSLVHSLSEFARMFWMYLLFFYLGVRVRTRRHVWAILGGLGVFAALETVVVILQWKTGGVLGLSFLGVPTQLGERTTDTSVIGRPFGTIIHPVFMGAVMGSLALVALALGLTLKRSVTKLAARVWAR